MASVPSATGSNLWPELWFNLVSARLKKASSLNPKTRGKQIAEEEDV
jgi:hypothetical protein